MHAVKRWGTTNVNELSPVLNLAVVSGMTVHQQEKLEDESSELLRNRSSEADHKKMDKFSRSGAPY